MNVQITPLGGFGEVGRNSVAVEVDGKIVILDMGFHLERFIELTEDDIPHQKHSVRQMIGCGALPDIRSLRKRKDDIVGIVCSHAHLDHIAAIPFLASKIHCPVHATPFTTQVIRSLCDDRHVRVKLQSHEVGSTVKLTNSISVEFISVAHSTPQSTILAVHTPYGSIIYGNDYKEDTNPPFGEPTNLNRFEQLKGKIKLLMLDCLYAPLNERSEGEQQARDELLNLKDNLHNNRAIIASTFSSNIYRLQSLCDLADSLDRKVIFLGRSLAKYIDAAKDVGLVDLTTRGEMYRFARQVNSFLRSCVDPSKYFIITTGHQGEPKAVLSRMAEGQFKFSKDDMVIFSCKTIPTPLTINNRKVLEDKLKKYDVSIIKDVHVSGHAAGLDHDKLISILEPEFVAPSHGEQHMMDAMRARCLNLGLKKEQVLFFKVGRHYNF